MATNDFLPFGTGANANVLSQIDYSNLPAREPGFTTGTARSIQLNKVWRQSSVIAAMIAQFIVDTTGNDALDDGDLAALQQSFEEAILTRTTADGGFLLAQNNLSDLSDVSEARSNLGLGSAALHEAGGADQQIPFMQEGYGLGGWGYGESTLRPQTVDLDTFPGRNGEVMCVTAASSGLPIPGVGGIVEFFCGETGPLAQQIMLTDGGSVRTWQRTRASVVTAWRPWVSLWHSGNFDPSRYQTTLGFTPVQQGGGYNQYASKVYMGYGTSGAITAQVDSTYFGDMWSDHIGVEKVRSAVVSFVAGTVGSYGLFRVYNGAGIYPGTLVAGGSLVYSDAGATSSRGSPSGTWMLMGGLNNADGVTDDSVTICLRVA